MAHRDRALERRAFLGAAGLAAVAVSAVPALAAGGAPSAAEQANLKLVDEFCRAWSVPLDFGRISQFLAEDAVYRASETAPPVKGRQAIVDRLKGLLGSAKAAAFEVVHASASGPIVMNERFDRFALAERKIDWHGVGVFYVKDSKIAEWSDFTIR